MLFKTCPKESKSWKEMFIWRYLPNIWMHFFFKTNPTPRAKASIQCSVWQLCPIQKHKKNQNSRKTSSNGIIDANGKPFAKNIVKHPADREQNRWVPLWSTLLLTLLLSTHGDYLGVFQPQPDARAVVLETEVRLDPVNRLLLLCENVDKTFHYSNMVKQPNTQRKDTSKAAPWT